MGGGKPSEEQHLWIWDEFLTQNSQHREVSPDQGETGQQWQSPALLSLCSAKSAELFLFSICNLIMEHLPWEEAWASMD